MTDFLQCGGTHADRKNGYGRKRAAAPGSSALSPADKDAILTTQKLKWDDLGIQDCLATEPVATNWLRLPESSQQDSI
jgi:hypothetical protein